MAFIKKSAKSAHTFDVTISIYGHSSLRSSIYVITNDHVGLVRKMDMKI